MFLTWERKYIIKYVQFNSNDKGIKILFLNTVFKLVSIIIVLLFIVCFMYMYVAYLHRYVHTFCITLYFLYGSIVVCGL